MRALGHFLFGTGLRRRCEGAGHAVGVGPVPRPEPVEKPVDLAEPRDRGERHRVDVVENDPAPGLGRLDPVEIAPARRGRHLLDLVFHRRRAAARRVPVLLDLCGERAAPRGFRVVEARPGQLEDAFHETVPFDRGVLVGVRWVHRLAVLDKEERLERESRYRIVRRVGSLRRADRVDRLSVIGNDVETRAVFLMVEGEKPRIDRLDHLLGHPRLRLDRVPLRFERVDERGETNVPEAFVVGARRREPDRCARPLRYRVADPADIAGKKPGLQPRCSDLPYGGERYARGEDHVQRDHADPMGHTSRVRRHNGVVAAQRLAQARYAREQVGRGDVGGAFHADSFWGDVRSMSCCPVWPVGGRGLPGTAKQPSCRRSPRLESGRKSRGEPTGERIGLLLL